MATRLIVLLTALSMACGDDDEGSPPGDAGPRESDGGPRPPVDAGTGRDAGPTDAGDVAGSCPLSPEARMLLSEVVGETVMGGTYVATMSHYREVAFAVFLPGVEEASLGVASLVFECMDESWYVPYCDGGGISPGGGGGDPSSAFWETRDRCGRLGCGGTGVDLSEVYLTMKPHTMPDDRHPFTYDSVAPPASVTYSENPLVLYRIERDSADVWRLTAQLSHAVDFALISGGTVALSHSGTINVSVDAGHIVTATYGLSFPEIAEGGAVAADVAIDATGAMTGAVVQGDVRLAEWSGALDHPVLTWLPPCSE